MAHGNRPTKSEIHGTPQSHRFVRGRWIPIDKVDSQIGLGLGKDLDRDGILAGMRCVPHIELIRAVRSRNLRTVGDLLSIHPDVRAVIDAVEMQPDIFSLMLWPKMELVSITPRALVRT